MIQSLSQDCVHHHFNMQKVARNANICNNADRAHRVNQNKEQSSSYYNTHRGRVTSLSNQVDITPQYIYIAYTV